MGRDTVACVPYLRTRSYTFFRYIRLRTFFVYDLCATLSPHFAEFVCCLVTRSRRSTGNVDVWRRAEDFQEQPEVYSYVRRYVSRRFSVQRRRWKKKVRVLRLCPPRRYSVTRTTRSERTAIFIFRQRTRVQTVYYPTGTRKRDDDISHFYKEIRSAHNAIWHTYTHTITYGNTSSSVFEINGVFDRVRKLHACNSRFVCCAGVRINKTIYSLDLHATE